MCTRHIYVGQLDRLVESESAARSCTPVRLEEEAGVRSMKLRSSSTLSSSGDTLLSAYDTIVTIHMRTVKQDLNLFWTFPPCSYARSAIPVILTHSSEWYLIGQHLSCHGLGWRDERHRNGNGVEYVSHNMVSNICLFPYHFRKPYEETANQCLRPFTSGRERPFQRSRSNPTNRLFLERNGPFFARSALFSISAFGDRNNKFASQVRYLTRVKDVTFVLIIQ